MKQQSIIYEHKYCVTKDPFIYQYMPSQIFDLTSFTQHPPPPWLLGGLPSSPPPSLAEHH